MCEWLILMMFLHLSFADWVFQAHSNFGLWLPEKTIRPEQGSNKCNIMSLTVARSGYLEKEKGMHTVVLALENLRLFLTCKLHLHHQV